MQRKNDVLKSILCILHIYFSDLLTEISKTEFCQIYFYEQNLGHSAVQTAQTLIKFLKFCCSEDGIEDKKDCEDEKLKTLVDTNPCTTV